jgi:hypothetical protein
MTVGFPIDQATINNVVGSAIVSLRDQFFAIKRLNAFIGARSAQELVDDYGYTLEEANLLKAALFDMNKLAQVADGQAEQVGTSDYWFHASQLAGLN